MNYRIAIVGAGLMGHRRAEVLKQFKNCQLVVAADLNLAAAQKLAQQFGGEATNDWRVAVRRPDVDVVIASTANNALAEVAIEALKNKKHVLCEKPLGRNVKEATAILKAAQKNKRLIVVGFNHRFHTGLLKAKEAVDKDLIGQILFIRARYGHGGRLGMEKEWRLQKKLSGGGELLDQGVHLIDLCRWLAGDFQEVIGSTDTKFWPTEVEDNAFVIMKNKITTAMFHVSTTNWGNIFSLEIFGDKGAITIDGKGGRYGMETLKVGIRQKPYNDLKTELTTFPDRDMSWTEEWQSFLDTLAGKKTFNATAPDGLAVNKIVEAVYKSSRQKKFIKI